MKRKQFINLSCGMDVQIPHTPNFLLPTRGMVKSVPIENFTDDDLKKIGDQFTKNLISKAQERRLKNEA